MTGPIFKVLIAVSALSFGCGAKPKTASKNETPPSASEPSDNAVLWRAAAVGQCDAAFKKLAFNPSTEIRAQVAAVAGRVDGDACIPVLRTLLADKESIVRAGAASAVLQQGSKSAADVLLPVLRERLPIAATFEERADILFALSQLSPADTAFEIVSDLLSSPERQTRRAAALCLVALAPRSGPDAPAVSKACALLNDADDEIRLLGAATIAVSKAPVVSDACAASLLEIVRSDVSKEARIQAARAVAVAGRFDRDALETALADEDPRVAAALLTNLKGDSAKRCAFAVSAVSKIGSTEAPLDHAGIVRFRAAGAVALVECNSETELKNAASSVLQKLEGNAGLAGFNEVVCLATALSTKDEIAVLACDPNDSNTGKKILMIRWSHDLKQESARQGLTEFVKDTDPSIAVFALKIMATGSQPFAARAVRDALSDKRAVVQSWALRLLAERPELGGMLPPETVPVQGDTPDPFSEIFVRYQPFDHAFLPLMSLADAAAASGDPRYADLLTALLRDTRFPVRAAARLAYQRTPGLPMPTGLPSLTLSPEAREALAPLPDGSEYTFVLALPQGDVTIALDRAAAPISVSGLVRSTREGYFDKTPLYETVPGRTVYLGDPTGTGLSDSGFFVPPETSKTPVERGSVVADLSTGGFSGRFFIALTRLPELDRMSVVLGHVTEGMDLLDRVDRGDRLISAHIFESTHDPKREGLKLL